MGGIFLMDDIKKYLQRVVVISWRNAVTQFHDAAMGSWWGHDEREGSEEDRDCSQVHGEIPRVAEAQLRTGPKAQIRQGQIGQGVQQHITFSPSAGLQGFW